MACPGEVGDRWVAPWIGYCEVGNCYFHGLVRGRHLVSSDTSSVYMSIPLLPLHPFPHWMVPLHGLFFPSSSLPPIKRNCKFVIEIGPIVIIVALQLIFTYDWLSKTSLFGPVTRVVEVAYKCLTGNWSGKHCVQGEFTYFKQTRFTVLAEPKFKIIVA